MEATQPESGPVRSESGPIQKLLCKRNLGNTSKDSLGISQLVALVYPIKKDAPSLGLSVMKH